MDYTSEFNKKLDELNTEQRLAVDHINGPVMVVAGPGTGKTQLLAMRVANILYQTDTLPSNILCLTFTEAAATNMVERLASIIGPDAYKVEIDTFHGFGSSIIGRYGEYFYNGATYQPADELTQGEIIAKILAKLPYNNPLRSINNGQFTYLRDIQNLINDLKKAAISPSELREFAQQNIDFCDAISDSVNHLFGQRMNAKLLQQARELVSEARLFAASQPDLNFTTEPKLANLMASTLEQAIDQAESGEKVSTKPLTAFKQSWCEKDSVDKDRVALKDQKRSEKILLAGDVYEAYLKEMDRRSLYDFGDMIIGVIRAVEQHPELKANLQEQYQYILVDEFQDTNDAQMRLLNNLTDYDDQPNLMVVGDDDQAIYRFQGADISNIQQFAERFPALTQINLRNNYRSGADILHASQSVSNGISSRLTNVDGTPKQLVAMREISSQLKMFTATNMEHEMDFVASSISKLIDQGENPGNIAVIGRRHNSLEQLVPYLAKRGVKVTYERQRDVFQSPLIQLIVALAKLVRGINSGNQNDIDENLPVVLACEAFGLSRKDYYKLCLSCRHHGAEWLDKLSADTEKKPLVDWLRQLGREYETASLNRLLLELVGTTETELNENSDESAEKPLANPSSKYRSPIFNYYFDYRQLEQNALTYLGFLNDIKTLIGKLKNYLPDREPKLADFIHYVNQCQTLGLAVYATSSYGDQNNVQLLSAHGSKGLEFKHVYIIDAESEQWGSKMRSRSGNLPYPHNLPIGSPTGDEDDERRRLLFVAMTRAKQNLFITAHDINDKGKELNALEYLLDFPNQEKLPEPSAIDSIVQLETLLMDRIAEPSADQRELLAPVLANYRLSATGLNSFTDVMNGGPMHFLLYNILRIPTATSGALALGNAIHYTMQYIHNKISSNAKMPPMDDVMNVYQQQFAIQARDLDLNEATANFNKGKDALVTYINTKRDSFNQGQRAEQLFQATIDDGIKLTGKLDCLEVDNQKHEIRIIDYKTGKFIDSFDEKGSDFTKAKARRYKQQLMFYKLLVEASGQYPGYHIVSGQLDFIEPDSNGQLHSPMLVYDEIDMEDFKKLLRSVWRHIVQLNLPDISGYSNDYQGIVDFESWLIENP